jgi:hypothetical protein
MNIRLLLLGVPANKQEELVAVVLAHGHDQQSTSVESIRAMQSWSKHCQCTRRRKYKLAVLKRKVFSTIRLSNPPADLDEEHLDLIGPFLLHHVALDIGSYNWIEYVLLTPNSSI